MVEPIDSVYYIICSLAETPVPYIRRLSHRRLSSNNKDMILSRNLY